MGTGLSDKTVRRLADALLDDTVKYISAKPEYAEFMEKMFQEFIHEKLGAMDVMLAGDISMHMMDNIYLESNV